MKTILHDGLVAVEEIQTGDNETLNGAGVDMQGFDSVCFIAAAEGGEADNFSLKAQQDTASNFGTAADLEGTSVSFSTTADPADGVAVLEIHQPQERYVRPVLTVPDLTAAKAVSIISIRYNSKDRPQSNTGELHVSPDEGTA